MLREIVKFLHREFDSKNFNFYDHPQFLNFLKRCLYLFKQFELI